MTTKPNIPIEDMYVGESILERNLRKDLNFYYKIEVIYGTKLSVVDKSELLRHLKRMKHQDGASLWGDIMYFGHDHGYGSEKFCKAFDENVNTITKFWLWVLKGKTKEQKWNYSKDR